MSHPCLVTLDRHSAPRVLCAGDRLVEVALPAGTRVVYGSRLTAAHEAPASAVDRALAQSHSERSLEERLRPGMRVTVVVDAGQHFGRIDAARDPRPVMIAALLRRLEARGVQDVTVLLAVGLERRLRPAEVQQVVGARSVRRLGERLVQHDAADARSLAVIAEDEFGHPIAVNRRIVESDLVVLCSVAATLDDGGYKPLILGLGDYEAWRRHFAPGVLAMCPGYQAASDSPLNAALRRQGECCEARVPVFALQAVLGQQPYARGYEFLGSNEDELSSKEALLLKGLVGTTARAPDVIRNALWKRIAPGAGAVAFFAGDVGSVKAQSDALLGRLLTVPSGPPADVVVTSVSPLLTQAGTHVQNPVLVHHAALSGLANLHSGPPLVRPGGTLIVTHPCTDRFDPTLHASYARFFNELLPGHPSVEQLRTAEGQYARDPALVEMFRKAHGYHPAHPFFLWYQGLAASQGLGKVICVGADNEYVPARLGWETAASIDEALYRARGGSARAQDILCLRAPPLVIAQTEPTTTGRAA